MNLSEFFSDSGLAAVSYVLENSIECITNMHLSKSIWENIDWKNSIESIQSELLGMNIDSSYLKCVFLVARKLEHSSSGEWEFNSTLDIEEVLLEFAEIHHIYDSSEYFSI